MSIIDCVVGFSLIGLSVFLFHFAVYKMKRPDRQIKVYIGSFLLFITGIAILILGIDSI